MNTPELLMFIIGLTLGAAVMNAVHGWWTLRDEKRADDHALASATARLKRENADLYLRSLRAYRQEATR